MSRPHRQLLVFARAPQYGVVKSRIATSLGPGVAWMAYRAMTRDVLSGPARSPLWRTRVAVAPARLAANSWGSFGITVVGQQGHDLGERMAHALRRYSGRGPVVLVGSDIPSMKRGHIRAAFDLLRGHDVVFGPASDGGYWLVGVRQCFPNVALAHLFDDVRWSSEHALADTLRNVRPGMRVAIAETLGDVDTAEDLAAWRAGRRT